MATSGLWKGAEQLTINLVVDLGWSRPSNVAGSGRMRVDRWVIGGSMQHGVMSSGCAESRSWLVDLVSRRGLGAEPPELLSA